MTSLSCNIDDSVNCNGAGPYVFKVHGKLSHKVGSLLPSDGQTPLYAQLYIYDGGQLDALEYCMGHAANHDLDRGTMQILQDTLYNHHPGVQLYKQALELTSNMPPEQQCKIALCFDEGTDHRCYNLPTAAAANEIAVILPGDGDQPQDCCDIILYHCMSYSFQLASWDGTRECFMSMHLNLRMRTTIPWTMLRSLLGSEDMLLS